MNKTMIVSKMLNSICGFLFRLCFVMIFGIAALGQNELPVDNQANEGLTLAPPQSQINKRLNYDAFCFYYSWYGNPQHDGKYIHWAHSVMKQHPSDTTTGFIPGGDNIGANFFPELGTYSNSDTLLIRRHMQMVE